MHNLIFLVLHLGKGGIETSTINTCNSLVKNYNIKIISFYKVKDNRSYELNKNINVEYILNYGPNKEEFKMALKNRNVFSILKEGIKSAKILINKKIKIIKSIRNIKNGVIVSTRMEFNILLSKYGRKGVLKIAQEHQYHNNDLKYINNIKNKYRKLDYLLALTPTLKKDYEKFLFGSKVKVVTIPNMINNISECTSNFDNNNLITVGRFHEVKRYPLLVEIFSKINNASKLFLIGDENGDAKDKKNIISKIEELNLEKKVIMPGFLDIKEIEKYLKKSSIFLMTSYTEGLPMVLLEAMNIGVPCIAFETKSGVSDIIKDGYNGYVIKDNNVDEYVKKVSYLLKNKNLLKKMSINAKKTVLEYSEENVSKLWIDIIDSGLKEKNKEKKIIFISSTGGHLSELLQLKPIFKKYDYYILTENTKSNKLLKNTYKDRINYLIYGTKKDIFIYPFKLLINCFISLYFYMKIRPKYIVTTGAHTAGPMCCIGKIFGSKIIYIETFANIKTKTITGRIIYLFADLFIVQWEEMLKLYPKAKFAGRLF